MQNLEIDKLLIDQVLKHTLSQTQKPCRHFESGEAIFSFLAREQRGSFLKNFFNKEQIQTFFKQSDLTLIYFAISTHLTKHYLYSSVLNEAQGPKDSGGTNYI